MRPHGQTAPVAVTRFASLAAESRHAPCAVQRRRIPGCGGTSRLPDVGVGVQARRRGRRDPACAGGRGLQRVTPLASRAGRTSPLVSRSMRCTTYDARCAVHPGSSRPAVRRRRFLAGPSGQRPTSRPAGAVDDHGRCCSSSLAHGQQVPHVAQQRSARFRWRRGRSDPDADVLTG